MINRSEIFSTAHPAVTQFFFFCIIVQVCEIAKNHAIVFLGDFSEKNLYSHSYLVAVSGTKFCFRSTPYIYIHSMLDNETLSVFGYVKASHGG